MKLPPLVLPKSGKVSHDEAGSLNITPGTSTTLPQVITVSPPPDPLQGSIIRNDVFNMDTIESHASPDPVLSPVSPWQQTPDTNQYLHPRSGSKTSKGSLCIDSEDFVYRLQRSNSEYSEHHVMVGAVRKPPSFKNIAMKIRAYVFKTW